MTALPLASAALSAQARSFNRIASFPVNLNLPEGMDPLTDTSPGIIAATADGMTLDHSDSPHGAIGMVDISDPMKP